MELASATDNSCTLSFPPASPHSHTNIHTTFECITHTYHDGRKRYSREKVNPFKEYEEKRSREEAVSQPHYYYYSIGGAEPPRSVCDGDHGACERTRMDVEARRGGGGRWGAGTRGAHGTNRACGVQCSHLVLQPSRLFVPHILSQPTYRATDPIGATRDLSASLRVPQRLRGVSAPCSRNLITRSRLHSAGDDLSCGSLLTVVFFLLNLFSYPRFIYHE